MMSDKPFMTRRMGRPGTDDCSFCGHSKDLHTGHARYSPGCAALKCGDPDDNRGRCAVYTSHEQAARTDAWFAALDKPIIVIPTEVANRFHERRYGRGEKHSLILSCPCAHEAMYYLGIEESLGVHWPDGEGGNAWDPHNLDEGTEPVATE